MEFRRINALPPYVLGVMDALKIEARRAGVDVIDLGFGNPDIPSPDVAVKKLAEAVENPRNHRYSSSRGIPKLRLAISTVAGSASSSIPRPRRAPPSAPRRGSRT
jgi:alanine-synthesizing transaminase